MDISLRGELWDNDSADVLRFWGWRDITAPMDIAGALERAGGEVAVYKTFIHGTPDMAEADIYYVDRIIKMLLWMKGGFKV